MEDWSEICRLHRAEETPIRVIARRSGSDDGAREDVTLEFEPPSILGAITQLALGRSDIPVPWGPLTQDPTEKVRTCLTSVFDGTQVRP